MRTGVWVGIEVEGALAWAMVLARFISAAFAGASKTPMTRSIVSTSSRVSAASLTSRSIWLRRGQPTVVNEACTTA